MPVGDIYEVRFEGISNEFQRWNQVWHWELVDEAQNILYDTSLELAEELAVAFSDNIVPLMHDTWQFLATRANRVYPSIGISAATALGAAQGGQTDGDSMPGDSAIVITKRTDQPTGRFRGRAYWGGLSENDQDQGVMSTAAAQLLIDAYEVFRNSAAPDGGGNSWLPVVFSRQQVADGAEPVADAIQRIEVDRVIRRQTGRGIKIGAYLAPSQP